MKDREKARQFLRDNENIGGRPPYTRMYKDSEEIPTISTGFNLNRDDAKEVIESLGANYEKIKSGEEELSVDQAQRLEDHILDEAEKIVTNKIGQEAYNRLGRNQQSSIISLCVNGGPSIIGPDITRYLQEGDFDAVANEIQHRSNRERHTGLQNRRDREAELFRSENISSGKNMSDKGKDGKDKEQSDKGKDQKDAKESKEGKDQSDKGKEQKEGKESKDQSDKGKEQKDGKESKEGKDQSDKGKDRKDGKESKEGKDQSDKGKDRKDGKESKEGKDRSDKGKDRKEGKEGKEGKDRSDKGKDRKEGKDQSDKGSSDHAEFLFFNSQNDKENIHINASQQSNFSEPGQGQTKNANTKRKLDEHWKKISI